MLSIGSLIWISCRPLLRLASCVMCGIVVTKTGIFPLVATKSVSQILVGICYPCLLFSKIVPAFTPDNLHALGPLVLVAFVYQLTGTFLGLVAKQFFWVPHRFRYGIIVAGAFGNVGDLPTVVLLSVTNSPPFNGTNDQNLSIAYVSVIILVFLVTLFPMGVHRLIMWDFVGPDVEPEEVKAAMRRKHRTMFCRTKYKGEKRSGVEILGKDPEGTIAVEGGICPIHTGKFSFLKSPCTPCGECSPERSPTLTVIDSSVFNTESEDNTEILPMHSTTIATTDSGFSWRKYQKSIKDFLKDFFSPLTVSILVSFPIALTPKLKALFVHVPGTYMPPAPDGQPPLGFLMDTVTFIGGSAIPMGLICLGSSLARLNIPKRGEWRKLPLGAIGTLAAGKLLITPIIGVLMCQGLTKVGFIPRDDKSLRFVCIFCSCLPTATTQVFLTQVYSGTGNAEDVSVFLIPQYFLMFFSMTALTAYTLRLLS